VFALEDLGRTTYAASWARQKEVLAEVIAGGPDRLLLVEHEPVFTLGRRREAAANVLAPGEVPVLEVERGGDVTFHGPGQLTAYPIVALVQGRQDLHRHLRELEEAAIRTCAEFGLAAQRDPRNTGAWVTGADGEARKVCSVGIACRRWVTWHGLALNVDVDLSYFARINPCGLDHTLLTNMAVELDSTPPMSSVKAAMSQHLAELLYA
jgi:lipoyl(octanoyl) transferase